MLNRTPGAQPTDLAVADAPAPADAGPPPRARLAVVADDLGRTEAVNRAIAIAHDRGIVTSASLMAGGRAFEGGVAVALARPSLSIGVHITLCDGFAVLPPGEVPDLAGEDGAFLASPAAAGWRCHRRRAWIAPQIEAEVEAQIDRVLEAGLRPDHVDGHHHLHMHPAIFPIVCRQAAARGIPWIRIPREDLSVALGSCPPRRAPAAIATWAIFRLLARGNRRAAARAGLRWPDRVYGLARTGSMDARYLESLFPRMRGAAIELFAHPDERTAAGRREMEALLSAPVRASLRGAGLHLSGHRDFPPAPGADP